MASPEAVQLSAQQAILLSDLYSVPRFREAHPYLFKSKGELDYFLRNRDLNGLSARGSAGTQGVVGRRRSDAAVGMEEALINLPAKPRR